MRIRHEDLFNLCIADGVWLILLLEHFVLHLDLALEFAYVWGIGALLVTIRVLFKYGISIKHP